MNLVNRKGVVPITIALRDELIKQGKNPLCNVFVTHMENDYDHDVVMYYGVSEMFKEIAEGDIRPRYFPNENGELI